MIYKIQSEKEYATLIFNTVENIGDFIFLHETFYLYTNMSTSDLKKKIKKALPKDAQFMVIDLNMSHISNQPSSVQSWIKDNLLKEEIKKYESENQETLKRFNIVIDSVYREFENQREGRVNSDYSEKE